MPLGNSGDNQGGGTAMRMAGEWFVPLLEHVDDIFVSVTPDMRIEYVSPAIERLLGYRQEEAVGLHVESLILGEDVQTALWPAASGDAVGADGKAVERGVEVIRTRHRDGGYVWCETVYRCVRDEAGKVVRYVAVCRDITERKRTEEELRHSKASLVLAQQIAGLGYYEWDFSTGRTMWSDELYVLVGYTPDDFANANEAFDRVLHPDDRERLLQTLAEAISRGPEDCRILSFEYRMIDAAGDVRAVKSVGKLLLDERGLPIRLFGTVRDVTTERQTEELLRKSEKLKMAGQLAAGIAHEIRNPLTSLKGFSKLLRTASGQQADRYYDIMDQEFVRIEMILGELLVLAKPQAVSYRAWDIRLIVQEVVELLGSQAILSNVVIWTELTESDCTVRCEKNQLKQVFMNLVKNAIEAMPSGGPLHVRVTRDGPYVLVRVADRGTGIPADKLQRVGEPFFTTKEKGTGLGLMVSYQIVEEHEGSMNFESEVGTGTTVYIRLPFAARSE